MTDADTHDGQTADSQPEESVKGASTKKKTNNGPGIEDVLAAVQAIGSQVKSLEERIETVERSKPSDDYPPQLPQAKSTAQLLSDMKKGEQRGDREYFGPPGRQRKFLDDDIVELVDAEKIKAFRSGFKYRDGSPMYPESEPILGVVQALMFHKRKTGVPKYKVDFGRGVGDDGVMEPGLKLVKRG